MVTPFNRDEPFAVPNRLLPPLLALLLILGPLLTLGQSIEADTSVKRTLLEKGKAVECVLAGGQKQIFEVSMKKGEMAVIELDGKRLKATIKLIDHAGEAIVEYPVEEGRETIEIAGEADGNYRIEIVGTTAAGTSAGAVAFKLASISEAPEKEIWRQQARRLSNNANALINAGKYDEALIKAEAALSLREKALGPESYGVANTLHMLASLYHAKADYAKALSTLFRAKLIYEKTAGPISDGLYRTLGNLGAVYLTMGDLENAGQFIDGSIEMQEKLVGADHPLVAISLNNLAHIYSDTGNFDKAAALYERALAIKQKAYGPDDERLSVTLNGLASVYYQRGDFVNAEASAKQALAISEKALGPDHPSLSAPMINLGNVYYQTGNLAQAEILYRRALRISVKSLGPDHPDTVDALNNLAEIHRDRREFANAEALFEQALAIVVKNFGESSISAATQLNNLGNLYRDQGAYSRAEPFYKRALEIREKLLGPDHPDVAQTLSNFARLHMATGEFAKAERLQARAIAVSERNADLNFQIGSERQKLAYLGLLDEQLDRAVTLNVSFAPKSETARDLAIYTVLNRKGRILDELSESRAALVRQLDAADAELLVRFNKLTSRLSRLVLEGPRESTDDEHLRQISKLKEEREVLEIELSRRSARFRARSRTVGLDDVKAALPPNAALLEFVVYNRFLPKGITAEERRGEARYAVYVISGEGVVGWKDLGAAKPIDAAVATLRGALGDPKRHDVQDRARILEEKIMRPIISLVGNATQLLISPDGALNLVPFETLVDEKGQYIVENYSISYLTSGRDLLRMRDEGRSRSTPMIVANPSFGEPGAAVSAGGGKVARSAKPRRRSITNTRSVGDTYFAPLEGTSNEAKAIQALFPEAVTLTKDQATETFVKRAAAPSILHLATHGFFLIDVAAKDTAKPVGHPHKIENPLLRSGLAFAGANERSTSGDDGILTALEASGLDLWGTKLVVLSACDTGVGEVRNGEGVYGLRRSFVLAGAESLVMSLWPVSDYVTRELMTGYYRNLKQGMGRGESLRRVQLEMIKRPNRKHPFYWASFIQTGEWASLDGKR